MESPVLAILGKVELGSEALESSVSDDLRPNFIPQSVAGLLVREDLPLMTLLKNKSPNSDLPPPSHRATSTVKV